MSKTHTDLSEAIFSHANHEDHMKRTYGDRVRLGKVWEAKVAAAKKAEGSPHHARHVFEAELARRDYDMAWLLERQQFQWRELAMLEELYSRVAIVEGAYGHVMAIANKATLGDALNASVSNMIAYHRRMSEDADARHAQRRGGPPAPPAPPTDLMAGGDEPSNVK